MTDISRLFHPKAVLFLENKSRDEALRKLIDQLVSAKKVKKKEEFFEAILAREKIVSTGIGMGVAIPHAKLPTYKNFFIGIGIVKGEGITWDSLDGGSVHLIIMIGGPEDKQTDYLQILSSLTSLFKNPERRKKLLAASDAKEVIGLLT